MRTLIKFFFKIIIVVCVAFAAVIYHNTDAGREMERRIGETLEFKNLKERGKMLIKKTLHFISLEGKAEGEREKKNERRSSPSSFTKPNKSKEKINEDERKRIEQIIEREG